MDRRWSDAMEKATIGSMHLLMQRPCMLVVRERLMDVDIIVISVLYFDVLFKYTLRILNFEGTRCSMEKSTRLKCELREDLPLRVRVEVDASVTQSKILRTRGWSND
jgi:hypothetical protein